MLSQLESYVTEIISRTKFIRFLHQCSWYKHILLLYKLFGKVLGAA